jgi:CRISPR/Cas system CMR-associated protein Cmr1 (group 7 of RAMP superfamily)
MEKNKNVKIKEINVPVDVLIDISKIILETEMENSIVGISENRSVIQIRITYTEGITYYQKAMENIDSILSDYKYYRFEEEESDWRDR